MTGLDLTGLAALRPQADELAARIKAGDVAACFDADEFLESVHRSCADARALVERAHVRTPGSDAYRDRVAFDAADGLDYVIGFLTGSYELQAELDDAREPDDD